MNANVLFTWSEFGVLDRINRAIGIRLAHAFGIKRRKSIKLPLNEAIIRTKSVSGRWVVTLPATAAFFDTFPTRDMERGDLKKALRREATNLSPLSKSETSVLPAQYRKNAPVHALLTVRTSTLETLVKKADELGASELLLTSETHPGTKFETPESLVRASRERSARLTAWLCLLGALWLSSEIFAASQATQISQLSADEKHLRRELTARIETSEALSTLGTVAAIHPETRTATARLETVAKLTTATPDHSYWTRININDTAFEITGVSTDSGNLLSQLSALYPDHTVRFSRPISDLNDREQSFVVELYPRVSQ